MTVKGEKMNEAKKRSSSTTAAYTLAGIGPEIAEFVTEFIESPEMFYSMPFERRREIEMQMDAILLSFIKQDH